MEFKLPRFFNVKALSVERRYFLIFLFVRLFSVWLVQTWFVPDEYWQSLEVAHRLVFGYGYLTWEWTEGIRSYLHPALIACLYYILNLLSLDNVTLLVIAPRLCQAVLSAYADLRFFVWCGKQRWAAFTIATSWFWFYTGSRTLINTLEASLSTIALSYFPWPGQRRDDKFLLWVALACMARPTAALLWFPLLMYHLFWSPGDSSFVRRLLRYVIIGIGALTASLGLDTLCHGELVLTAWRFLRVNVLEGVGIWYGSHPWHWYMSSGLPAVLGLHLLPFTLAAIGAVRSKHRSDLLLLFTVVWTVAILSLLPHKEFRFLMPVLPCTLRLSAGWLSRWSRRAAPVYLWLVAGALLLSNALPAMYLGTVHQRGTIDVMEPLAEIAAQRPNDTSVLFLMPCHSTPLYSHVHVNVPMRFLTCEPPADDRQDYKDEADRFYENPNLWLHGEYPPDGTLPSHIVTFDTLVPSLSSILSRYKPLHRFSHASVPLSSRQGYHVLIHQHLDF